MKFFKFFFLKVGEYYVYEVLEKGSSLCQELKYFNPYICATWWYTSLIIQQNRIQNIKDPQHWVAKLRGSKNQSLWQRQKISFEFYQILQSKVNLIPAGVLENQDMLGGGQLDPPSKSYVLCPNITNDTSLESSCALLLESAKEFANLQKLNFLSQNPVIQ